MKSRVSSIPIESESGSNVVGPDVNCMDTEPTSHSSPPPSSAPSVPADSDESDAINALYRAIETAAFDFVGGRQANTIVSNQLEQVRGMLARLNEQRLAMKQRLDQLELELQDAMTASEGEKEFLIHQQDQFLSSLLDDHERSVEALRAECDRAWRRVSELQTSARDDAQSGTTPGMRAVEANNLSRDVVLRAKQQRDEAQRQTVETLSKLDAAHAELERLRMFAAPSTLPPGPELPISIPPIPPARPARAAVAPSTEPVVALLQAGWRRSVPPLKRRSPSLDGWKTPIASNTEPQPNPGPPTQPAPHAAPAPYAGLQRSDLPSVASPDDELQLDLEIDKQPPLISSNQPSTARQPHHSGADASREAVGGYSLTLGAHGNAPRNRSPK